jgi:hypothetical protein
LSNEAEPEGEAIRPNHGNGEWEVTNVELLNTLLGVSGLILSVAALVMDKNRKP